ncbi:MAG: hypothetical protein ACRDBO_19750 [Lachnospiraceae bacterium]
MGHWCNENGITKAKFYYRLRRVRDALLADMPGVIVPASLVVVPKEIMYPTEQPSASDGFEISIGSRRIHLTTNFSMELLGSVLQVIAHVK